MKTVLLDNVSVNTNGDAKTVSGSNQTLIIEASNFGGGTVEIQVSRTSGASWVPLTINGTIASFTSNGAYLINRVSQSYLIRAVLNGSTSASNVNVEMAD